MAMELVWQQAAPPRHANDESAPRFFWSPDDRWACIWYSLWEWDFGVGPWADDETVQAMYIWDLDTKDIHQVLDGLQMGIPQDPCFSSDSNIMLIPWLNIATTIDIFSWSQRQIVARVSDSRGRQLDAHSSNDPFDLQTKFSPDNLRFAVARNHDVRIYNLDGVLQSVVCPDLPPSDPPPLMLGQVAWSPTGSRIAFWHPATPKTLHIFQMASASFMLEEVLTLAEHDPAEACAGLFWGPYGPLPIFGPLRTTRFRSGAISSMQLGFHGTGNCRSPSDVIQSRLHKQEIGGCMPALSPDGQFVAAIAVQRSCITVHDASADSVKCCAMVPLPRPGFTMASDHFPSLAWAPSGRRLVLQLGRIGGMGLPEVAVLIIQF